MTPSARVSRGFVAAGLMNVLGVLVFSRAFTNDYLTDLHPGVFSRFGLLVVVLWGLAYLATARVYRAAPAIVLVFAVEKAVYAATWFVWLAGHGGDFGAIWRRDPLTAVFYAIYGPNDLLFGLFFLVVGFRAWVDKA